MGDPIMYDDDGRSYMSRSDADRLLDELHRIGELFDMLDDFPERLWPGEDEPDG